MFQQLLVQPLANGLALFYQLFGQNMGVAIILFSVALKFALYPLTKSSLQNMKKMKDLRPALDKLKKKYKGDKQGLMKAQADLYKQKGFNPGAGCIPQILQLVVLYAFFGVFNKMLSAQNPTEALNSLLYDPLRFQAGQSINTHFLYLDITKPDVFNIPGIPFGLPGPLLIIAAITQFISIKIMSPVLEKEEKIVKKSEGDADDALVASQQYMMYLMPVMTIFIGLSFASGLALYWFVFSVVQTYQQYRISGLGGLAPLLAKLQSVAKRG